MNYSLKLALSMAFVKLTKHHTKYTWWSNRGQSWANNVGWRIDYQILTPNLKGAVKSASIYKDERFSDHAPLIMDYHYEKNYSHIVTFLT
ncbi:Exodeoxyribonuclease III (EC [uncultured Gammaproteobacteria bacterium]|nr:Exodeoxyribonuclease III (EC [uncultured Gammaproteobacteria bacterium]